MPRVKSFSRGGIQLDSFRSLTRGQPIRPLFLPSLAIVPLSQYPGARAQWLVESGESVAEDQILAQGLRAEDLPVHSPIPGTIQEFREITLPGGLVTSAALIRLEGEFRRTGKPAVSKDLTAISDGEMMKRIASAGLFLESSPLDPRRNWESAPVPGGILVINALQPEPYLTLSIHLLDERGAELVEGIRILQRLLRPARTILVADPEQPESWLRDYTALLDDVERELVGFKYPQAQEGLLLKTIGLALNQKSAPKPLILDVSSVIAIRDAVLEGKPQVEKTIVLTGKGVKNPGAYLVRIGTPLVQLLRDAGGLHTGEHRILLGGPFLGQEVDHLSTPVLKSTSAILVLDKDEVNLATERPCVRCGVCVQSCPVGLEPLNLHKSLLLGKVEEAREEGLDWCIGCGICSYVCPSRIPLAATFHAAKEVLHGH